MIGRTIPADLIDDLSHSATLTCRLLRIAPIDVSPFGITTLDRDVIFDDGDGPITYRARRGYTASDQVGSTDLSVENSEAEALLAEYPLDGLTADMIRRGVLDDARFVEYLVNYQAIDHGAAIMGSGTVGELRAEKGLRVFIERRSLTQTLKQKSIIELGSVSCRAQFGDERCKYDVDSLWQSATVTAVGDETDRTFTLTLPGAVPSHYVPGLVRWTSGDNSGRTYEIEAATVDGDDLTLSLSFPCEDVIAVGDAFDFRPDCSKEWGEDDGSTINSCKFWDNRLNFRGEALRPVADSAALAAPGGPGGGSSNAGSTQAVSDL